MTIRQTLLIAFLMFSIVTAALMTALAYSRSRSTLSSEVRLTLEAQAITVMRQIDAMLFERIKNIQGWSRLELMQELKVGDVDKRLARFLHDIELSYGGIYTDIFCVRDARVVAASDAALIGTPVIPAPPWLEVPMQEGRVILDRPQFHDRQPRFTLRTNLTDAVTGEPLGEIHALLDWNEVSRLLDQAVGRTQRLALLLDQDARVLGASSALRKLPNIFALKLNDFGDLQARHGVVTGDGSSLKLDTLLVGFARSTGYKGMPDLAWDLMILTPKKVALEQVQQLLWKLLGLLAGIVVIAIVLAIGISGRIARPIQALTTLTRAVGQDADTLPAVVEGGSEVAELSVAFNRMIADLRHSREHLVRASKLAAVGEMAAMLAHEVRNPLGIMRTCAQLLSRQQNLDARGAEMLDYMVGECDRINDLVTGLLDSARPHDPVYEPNDINEIVRHVTEMLRGRAREKNIAVEFDATDTPCILDCDRDQMIQVLLNLLMNAIQIAPVGGHIVISAEADDDYLSIRVEDDGPGVPPNDRESIIEPFVSHRPGGIGLGLSIVHEIIQMHRGTMSIDSSEMGGASFTIRAPLRRMANA